MITDTPIAKSATKPGESPMRTIFVKCDVCRRKTISFSIASPDDPTRPDPDTFIVSSLMASGWTLRDGNHVCNKCDELYRRGE